MRKTAPGKERDPKIMKVPSTTAIASYRSTDEIEF
jgi:hypothetical protein